MSGLSKSKRKYKNYTSKNNHKYKLDVNLKGFLCSCNNREKECVKESYNLLNKYYDKFYNQDKPAPVDDNIDIADSLKNEISQLKTSTADKRFQVITSGAKNLLFIRTTIDHPVDLVVKIFEEIYDSKEQQTMHLLRLIPVETTCKAFVEDIKRAFTPLAEKYFKAAALSYSIIYNHRNNDNVSKDDLIKSVAEIVSATRDDHKVNLKGADISIIIEVIRGYAFLSVLPNYFKYKKYNLLAICSQNEENEPEAPT